MCVLSVCDVMGAWKKTVIWRLVGDGKGWFFFFQKHSSEPLKYSDRLRSSSWIRNMRRISETLFRLLKLQRGLHGIWTWTEFTQKFPVQQSRCELIKPCSIWLVLLFQKYWQPSLQWLKFSIQKKKEKLLSFAFIKIILIKTTTTTSFR